MDTVNVGGGTDRSKQYKIQIQYNKHERKRERERDGNLLGNDNINIISSEVVVVKIVKEMEELSRQAAAKLTQHSNFKRKERSFFVLFGGGGMNRY